jgi:hypothetical protein
MKTIYKSFVYSALTFGLCWGLLSTTNAQSKSSGSSGSHSSGGGGGARPSGGGGISRPSGGMMAPRGGVAQGMRQGANGRQGFAQRQGGNSNQIPGLRANYISPQRQGVSVNQNIAGRDFANGRVGVSTQNAVGYRNSNFNHGRADFWGGNHYVYHNHGYYNTGYLPRIGFRCTVLPYGYYPFFWGDAQYYFSDGLFYEYENDEYTVVEPPIGAEVTALPSDAQSIVINGQQYYESQGVYYQPYTKDDGSQVYVVAGKDGELNTNTVQDNQPKAPQIGDIVTQLPPNCRKIAVSGQKLFVSPDGIYYQPVVDANNVTTYKIVGLPSDELDQN